MKGLIMVLLSPFFFINSIQASCVKGNCKIGFGVFLFPDGSKYIGNFKHGNPDGKGKIFLKKGDVYEGSFVNGKMHGEGKYYFKSGDVFIGQFNNNHIEGKGRMDYSDDTIYKGEWKKNQPDGKGTLIDRNGEEKHGYWEEGKMIKKITDSDTKIRPATVGREHKNCNKKYCDNESGKFTYGDGSFYIGQFKNGEPYGIGVCYYANGDVYEGGWKNHGPEGK